MDESIHFIEAPEPSEGSDPLEGAREDWKHSVFVGSSLYVFFRYYQVRDGRWCDGQILYERMLAVARLCVDAANHKGEFQVSNTGCGEEDE